MVICKYFLQGTCRFGDNCKFEHQIGNEHSYTNSSILLQNQPTKTTTNVDTTTLVKAVVNDMTIAEKGGQWLLTSYAPFKEKPGFPGFEDSSMEEIRYLFYEAVRNGTVEQYKQNLQMMLQQAVMRIKALQNPSHDTINMLKNIYNTPPSSIFNNQTPFGGSGGGGNLVSGGAQTQNSVFGGAGTNSGNIFGGGIINASQQSVFGGTSNSPFGGAQNSGKSIFGGGESTHSPNSIFGGQQKSIFGSTQISPTSSNSIFGTATNQNNIFGSATQTTQQNVFQTSSNQFGNVTNTSVYQQSPFGTSQQMNQFGFGGQQNVKSNTNTQFESPNSTTSNNSPFQHTQNIFGNIGLQNTNRIFGNEQTKEKPNEEFYSKLEDLTEEEIKWFQSDDLSIEKIPEKPPTYEMCFRSG